MNFNEVTWWWNVVLETAEIENQEKHEVARMSAYYIPCDAEFNVDFKNMFAMPLLWIFNELAES